MLYKTDVKPCEILPSSSCVVKCEVVQGQLQGRTASVGKKTELISGVSSITYFCEPDIKSSQGKLNCWKNWDASLSETV